jgi:hypothetical protein
MIKKKCVDKKEKRNKKVPDRYLIQGLIRGNCLFPRDDQDQLHASIRISSDNLLLDLKKGTLFYSACLFTLFVHVYN